MSPLRKQMTQDLMVRGLAERTQILYLNAVAGLAKYHRRSPDELSAREVQAYLFHLSQDRGLAWSSCNVVSHGLRFFYRVTLGRSEASFYVPCAKEPTLLPEILSGQELVALFEASKNIQQRALLMTTYSAGLRVSEVVRLKVTDIDSQRMSIRVHLGKGRKDRYTLLSPRLLQTLRDYWQAYRPAV